jgi:hypothetical protein
MRADSSRFDRMRLDRGNHIVRRCGAVCSLHSVSQSVAPRFHGDREPPHANVKRAPSLAESSGIVAVFRAEKGHRPVPASILQRGPQPQDHNGAGY